MRTRQESLRQLASLYRIVEEMHAAELQRLTATLREVGKAIGMENQAGGVARSEGRDALMSEDRLGWEVAETKRESVMRRRRGLEQISANCEELQVRAQEQYAVSRLKSEQIGRIAAGIRRRAEEEERRRLQALTDDRFLARRRWTDTKERRRLDR